MTVYVVQLVVRECLESKDPLQAISIVATVLAGYYGLLALWQTETTIVTEQVHVATDDDDTDEKCKDD